MDEKMGFTRRSIGSLRLAFVLATGSFSVADRRLVATYEKLAMVTGIMHELLTDDGRDDDEIEGYLDLADQQRNLTATLASSSALGMAGILAKARGALLRPIERGYEGSVQISISLCQDLVRLARSKQ